MSTTRAECIADAGKAYGAMLADPVMRERLRAARHRRAQRAATQTTGPTSTGEKPARSTTPTT